MSGVNSLRFCIRSPSQLAFLPSPLLSCSLIWTSWENFLQFSRQEKPISKTGACKMFYFHHSSASESNHWSTGLGWGRCLPQIPLSHLLCFLHSFFVGVKEALGILLNAIKILQAADGKNGENVYSPVRKGEWTLHLFYIDLERLYCISR